MQAWHQPIEELTEQIEREFGLFPVCAGEIECSVSGWREADDKDVFWQAVLDALKKQSCEIESIAKEDGEHQYEIRLKPETPLECARHIALVKEVVLRVARKHALKASFDAQPEPESAGNGLHMHLHLNNDQGANVFLKKDEQMTEPLKYAIGGLLATMHELMLCFAPTAESYKRFERAQDHVPQRMCWGGNNRSVALRLPGSVVPTRRIEHRVSGADANPYAVMWALLLGVDYGLKHDCDPGPQIYGIATDDQYDLPRLPTTLERAQQAFRLGTLADRYMKREMLEKLLSDSGCELCAVA